MLKLGIKFNLKENVLSGFKLLSRDSVSYEIQMRMYQQAPTRDCKQYFETANYSRISHGSLPQRGIALQMAKLDI